MDEDKDFVINISYYKTLAIQEILVIMAISSNIVHQEELNLIRIFRMPKMDWKLQLIWLDPHLGWQKWMWNCNCNSEKFHQQPRTHSVHC